jgi:peptidoglycan/xylan/chitin deacetylase (PgdA/CDA1 family)
MENTRYDYSPIITRKPFELPNGAKVALYVGVAIEYWAIDSSEFAVAGLHRIPPPNVFQYAPRDYGNRIGVWRVMEVLDRHNIKASVFLNSDICEHHPIIIEEGKKRDWEFIAHSTSNAVLLGGKSEAEERRIIKTTMDVIAKAVGRRPIGWAGAALQETFNTPDILAEEGIKYTIDWTCDDQPFPMKVKTGSLIAMPYTLDLNDIPAFIDHHRTPKEFYEMIKDQFDTLYKEGASQARIMCIAVHPFLTGLPFRIAWLDKALQYIKGFKDVWFTTSGEIAKWYYQKYMGEPI